MPDSPDPRGARATEETGLRPQDRAPDALTGADRLHAARGRSNACIARETGLHLDTARTWRGRYAEQGLSRLADRKRTGRPAAFSPLQAARVKALACQLPAETGARQAGRSGEAGQNGIGVTWS
ncbi:helix-turn-helix domain-containing protein [Streptomyces puniciscabiei]